MLRSVDNSASTSRRWAFIVAPIAVALALAACARERVEVAEMQAASQGADAALDTIPALFPVTDARPDAACSDPREGNVADDPCSHCPHGHLIKDGDGTCECCE